MFRRNRLSTQPATRTDRRPARRHAGTLEPLERRELLSAAIVNAIPSVIAPTSGGQSFFAPGVTRQMVSPSGAGTYSQFYQFALDGTGFTENARFELKPAINTPGNSGLALYDENGNLITKADSDVPSGNLTADLQTRRRYILGVFTAVPGVPFNYNLVSTTGTQLQNGVLRIDPATGTAPATGANPEDPFASPTDVDYYPLDLANAGASGTVAVTPTGPDVKVSAALFRRADATQPWERIDAKSDANGAAVTLNLSPGANGTLSDGQYLLAVAPLGMNTAAGSYTVNVSAAPVLGPATVNSVTATDLSTLAPLAPNVAGATRSTSIPAGGDAVYKFRVPAGGPVSVTLHSDAFQPMVSLYNGSGLVDVASRTVTGDASLTYNATAGEQLVVRVGDVGNNTGGAYNLGIQSQYGTTALPLQAPYASAGPIQVGPDQTASFFRVQPSAGADVLLVEAQPGGPGVGARIVVVGQNMAPVEISGAAGQKVLLPATIAGLVGPFDVYVAGSAGAGPVTVRVGQFDVPNAIDPAALSVAKPDLQGDFTTGSVNAGAYGALSGVKYFQLPIAPGQPAPAVSVQGNNGSRPLLAVYGDEGGQLKLTGFATPSPSGAASLTASPVGDRVTAAAAFSLNFDGGGTNVFSVNAPAAVPVSIGMVPDLSSPGQFASKLSIREVKLGTDFEQDFWETRLPTNMTANPAVTFTPRTAGSGLAAKVTVYRNDNGTLTQLGSFQTAPGGNGNFALQNFASLQNVKVAFLVEPLAGNLGDGIYTLEMSVATGDPHPFEVTETAWKTFGSNPAGFPAGGGTLPLAESIRDIIQNQLGDGSAEGQFTSSQPYNTGIAGNTGAIDVYRFWSVNDGPLTVRTVAIDESVNTNIKVYRARFDNTGSQVVQYVEQIPNVYGSFDWMPADRTTVDAQVIVNDYEGLQYGLPNNPYRDASDFNRLSGGMYFVVVKNQEGSLGRYRVEVNAPNFPELGGISATTVPSYQNALANQVAYLPADGSGLQLKLNYTDSFNEFVGMFPVQMPAFHNGVLSVTSGSKWDFELFDAAGMKLPKTETDGATTSATFTVPAGSRTVFLRVKEQAGTATPNASAVLTLSADTTPPTTSPAAVLPSTPGPVLLPVDPFADARATRDGQGNILTDDRLHDSFTGSGQTKVYTFRAPAAGPMKFTVSPDTAGAMNLQWAVYVNGSLKAWNLTRQSGGAFDPLTTTLDLHLPSLTDPTPSDTAAIESLTGNVQVWVRSVGAPAAGQGGFTVEVDNGGALPTVYPAGDLDFNPIQLPDPIINRTINGNTFYRLSVPDHTTGGVTIDATPNNTGIVFGSQQLRWELYGSDGQKISQGTASTDFVSHKATFTIPEATGGAMYFLRLGVTGDASLTLDVTVHISMIKQFGNKPAATMPLLAGEVIRRTSPPPSGIFTTYHTTVLDNANPNVKESYAFWVQNGGVAHFDAFFNPGNNVNASDITLAVYRMTADAGEFATYGLELVDYTNSFGMVDGRYSLDVYLDPGAYVLKAIRASTGFVSSHVNWRLPAYTPEEVVLDPNSGSNATLTNLLNVDDAPAAVNPLESFRTHFYRVVAPGAAQGAVSATAINLATDDFGFEDRNAFLSMWQADAAQPGGYRPFANGAGTGTIDPPAVNNTTIFPATVADPGEVFYLALNRNGLSSKIGVGLTFDVPQSGTADFVVDPIQLSPDNGQTKVTITVHNRGYAAAGVSNSRFAYTNTSGLVTTTTEAILQQLPLGPLGAVTITLPWLPTRPADQVFFTADYDHKVAEAFEDNNDESVALSTVDAHRPTLALSLSDALMDANPAANVWGRYISGVDARTNLLFNAQDADGKLLKIQGFRPYEGLDHGVTSGQYYYFAVSGSAGQVTYSNYNFGRLFQTQGNNPNHFTAYAIDEYGLVSDEVVKTIQVVPMPSWLDNDSSSVTFDPATHKYKLNFQADILRYEATINQLVHASIPFIGDKENLVLGEVYSSGVASLDPSAPIELPLKAHAQVTVLGEDILNETWEGTTSPTDHFSISTFVHLDSTSLEADQFEVTFRLTDLPLFNFQSPEIPLFAYGIPDVASINANLQFSLNAKLDAALTLALRPDGQGGVDFGLATPTFIRPEITAGLAFSGEIEVLGFDIASLSGAVNFKLAFAYGLDTSDVFVPFLDFFNEAELNVNGELWGNIHATVLGFEVLDFDFPHLLMDFSSGGTVATAMAPILPRLLADQPAPVVPGGDQPIADYAGHESPGLVIDPATGNAMYVQAVDTDDTAGGYFGGLRYARRQNGGWSALQPLATQGSASDPVLALSHDGAGSPSVLAYQAYNGAGGPVGKTRNQYLAGQDLRYRYFDGANWGPEQSLTNDGLYDGEHAMAFNAAGKGALAWVHNKNANPVAANGAYARGDNEIMVSLWDAATHTWGAPIPLTTDSTADGRPSVYVAQDGTVYVAWLRDTAGGNEIAYRTYANGTWSNAATLPVTGLPPGGRLRSVALGGDASGKFTTMIWYSVTDPDVNDANPIPSDSRLYARTTTAAGFGQAAAATEVAKDGNYSDLAVTNAPDGSLLAYWAQSDGQVNDLYAARRLANGTWAQPVRLTGGSEIEQAPSLAIDTDGSYALVYEKRAADTIPQFPNQVPQPTPVYGQALPLAVAGQVGTAVLQDRPELSFSRQMFFPAQDQAAQGSQAVAEATVVNTGLADATVLVEFLEYPIVQAGEPVVLGSQQVFLKAGTSTDLSHAFVVKPGQVTYGMRVSPVGSSEAVSGADNVSTATLAGKVDIAVVSVTPSVPEPKAGQAITLNVVVKNLSNVATGSFGLSLFEDDPTTPNYVKKLINATTVSLAANETKTLSFAYTVPASGGSFILTAVADPSNAIAEATEANNTAGTVITARPDARVVETAPGVTATATVLNFTGVNNVRVDGVVRNDGDAPLTNLKVRLMWSLKDGDYVAGQTQTLAQLLPGQSINVSFTAAGLAGMNRYLIVVDPDNERPDADRTNNVGQAGAFIQGLPDLKVQDFTLDQAAPMQNVPLTLNATLQNVGIDDAQNVEVEVYARLLAGPGPSVQLPASGLLVGKVKLDLVKALASTSLSIDIDTSKLIGPVELSLVVDPKLKIVETTDLNNAVTKTFTFVMKGARVEGRRVFYNNSRFDGKNPAPNAADDAAIATDKQALLPGQTATFANLTSYARGINGIMIDVSDLPKDQTVSVEDFAFKMGNSLSTTGWVNAPAASSVTVRRGAGANGSDRITIIWPDGAIRNKWLQVMVRANTRTGLTAPDVFYFGNLVGETGNAAAPAVNALDLTATRSQVSTKAAGVTSRFDFDHNGRVDAGDLATVRGAIGKSLVTFAAPPIGAASVAGSDSITGRYRPTTGGTFSSGRVIDTVVDPGAAAVLN